MESILLLRQLQRSLFEIDIYDGQVVDKIEEVDIVDGVMDRYKRKIVFRLRLSASEI